MKTTTIILILSVLNLMACQVGPVAINYGNDACHYCKMTIVDKQHSAELVTVKGKAFKYDAIECMMHDLEEWEHPEVAHFLVADFEKPGNLTDATKAQFLISKTIPSPMGEFLSAFEEEADLINILKEHQGERFDWGSLKRKYNLN